MATADLYIADLSDTIAGGAALAGSPAVPVPGTRYEAGRPADAAAPMTLAGREDEPTTLAVGEEGDDGPTTLAVGEEGDDGPTTLAVGEEGDDGPTTKAVGEEGDDDPTTLAVGEEGDDY